MSTNWISPTEAMMTPRTMRETLPSVLSEGGETPMAQEVRRVTTGMVALSIWMKETERWR